MCDKLKILISEEKIRTRVNELGKEISNDFIDKGPLFIIGVLNGALFFTVDLIRKISLPVKIDFLALSSYGEGTVSQGKIKTIKNIQLDVYGKNVLIVEDIVDSGKTILWIKKYFKNKKPNSLSFCSLIDKTSCRTENVNINYKGFVIENHFIVGYGMDYAEKYRNLPYIGILDKQS